MSPKSMIEYAFGFAFGWTIFQALFGARYGRSCARIDKPGAQLLSMNFLMAMLPTVMTLRKYVPPGTTR